jgi:dTDP-4-dehydrorhamnose reductase
LVYISTDAVFDGAAGGYSERDPVSPLNQYARSKMAGEIAVLREMPDALILRTTIYGWNLQPKHSLAEWALARLEGGQPVPGFADVTFAPVLVNDLARWILELIHHNSTGIFHVGSAEPCSKYQFLCQTADVFNLNAALVRKTCLADSTLAAPRPRHTWLRVDKIAATLGHPMPAVRDGLEHFRHLREDGLPERLKVGCALEEE